MSADPRRAAWERATEWPLAAAALGFLVAYAWPILEPGLPATARTVCSVVTWAAWIAFVVDYVARVRLSEDRWRFVRRHLLDLAVIALPLLRPLRLLRIVTTLTILSRRASNSFRGRVALYVASGTVLLWFCASLAVLDAERSSPEANITTFGDAVWWSITTMSTVGYGDHFPVTTTGRFVAGGLMITGIALLGLVSASFASWLVQRVTEIESTGDETQELVLETQEIAEETQDVVEELRAEVARLTALLEEQTTTAAPAPGGDGRQQR